MAWAFANNSWTQTGASGSPVVWMFTRTRMPAVGSMVLQGNDIAKLIGERIYADLVGANCYRVVADGGTGGNLHIYKITNGTAGASIVSAPHGLTTGEVYRVEVRWVAGVITVYVNGASTPLLTWDTSNDLGDNTYMGFDSTTDGAVVGSVKIYTLTQTFAALADVLWAVAGGILYASDTGPTGMRPLGTFFDPAVRVVGTEHKQAAFIIDGSKVVKFDAVAMTAALFTPSVGTLPGQTSDGTTTAKGVISYNDRLGFFEGTVAIFSAIGEEDNFDLTVDDFGKAFAWPADVGEPLVGWIVAGKNRLIMFARNSMWELTGDVALGAEVNRVSDDVGASGPNSACKLPGGIVLVHADQGLYQIPPGGYPIPVSVNVLTDPIQTQTGNDTMYVSLCFHPSRFGVWVFLTSQDDSARGTSFWYDLRTGKLDQNAGGFWPVKFGDVVVEPTFAVNYRNEVIVGTRNGRLLKPDRAVKGNDDGHNFTSRLGVQLIRAEDLGAGILLYEMSLIMGLGSDPATLTIFGGEVPERAYDATRWQLWDGLIDATRDSFYIGHSSPALVLEIQAVGTAWILEAIGVDYSIDVLVQSTRIEPADPPGICQPPQPTTPTPGETPGGGPGPGGGGEACTACADWMDMNSTGDVGGQPAYSLAGPNILSSVQAQIVGAVATLLAANICDLGEDPNLYVTTDDPAFVSGPVISYSDLLLLNPGDYDPEIKTWRVSFRCADNPGV